MKIFIFGNGNTTFDTFLKHYIKPIQPFIDNKETKFILCDFRGVDTLMMEYLKSESKNVSIYHMGEKPRYQPDKFKTKVHEWEFNGGYKSDRERDGAAIEACTHYLALDNNSNDKRKSGTLKNIELCESLKKISING